MNPRSIVAIAVLALAPALASPAAAARTYSLTGDDVAIWNPAGEIHVVAGSGSAVEVEVDLQGRDAGQVRVSDEPLGGHPTLRLLYPEGHSIVYPAMGRWSNTSADIRGDGTWGDGRHDFRLFGRGLRVKGSGSGTEAWADLVVRVPRGRTISLHSLAGAGEFHNVDGTVLYDGGAGGVRVENGRGRLTVDVGSGGVEVGGFEGDLDVDTGSGSVRASNVHGSRVRLDTGSGGVTADHLTADDLLVDTGSGSVEMSFVDAKKAKVDTGSGGVELGLLTRTPDLDIDTGSGSVRVTVPQDLNAKLHIETGSGGIRSEVPVTIEEKDTGLLRGSVGAGTGRLHVDTGSGGVTLLAANTTQGSTRAKPR